MSNSWSISDNYSACTALSRKSTHLRQTLTDPKTSVNPATALQHAPKKGRPPRTSNTQHSFKRSITHPPLSPHSRSYSPSFVLRTELSHPRIKLCTPYTWSPFYSHISKLPHQTPFPILHQLMSHNCTSLNALCRTEDYDATYTIVKFPHGTTPFVRILPTGAP